MKCLKMVANSMVGPVLLGYLGEAMICVIKRKLIPTHETETLSLYVPIKSETYSLFHWGLGNFCLRPASP